MKIGLALGGGGVRGMAHIGVLEAFHESGIEVDLIAGTSMGAVVGASYCLNKDVERVKNELLRLVRGREIMILERLSAPTPEKEKIILIESLATFVKELYLWNMRAVKKWLIDNSKIAVDIEKLVQGKEFKDLNLPFFAVACDLKTGREIILSEGKLKDALLASIAVPGVFNPIYKGDLILVDGGIISLTPINACRGKGADFVIAVDVAEAIVSRQFTNGMEMIFQSDLITQYELNRLNLEKADFVIAPDVKQVSWGQFSLSEECINKGREAAQKVVSEIKFLLKEKRKHLKRKKSFMKKIFSRHKTVE